ncbi:hypothetical protein D3C87_1838960 [compost metagenome]
MPTRLVRVHQLLAATTAPLVSMRKISPAPAVSLSLERKPLAASTATGSSGLASAARVSGAWEMATGR